MLAGVLERAAVQGCLLASTALAACKRRLALSACREVAASEVKVVEHGAPGTSTVLVSAGKPK